MKPSPLVTVLALTAAIVTATVWAATPTSNVPISAMPPVTNANEQAYFPLIQPYPGRFTNDNFRVTASNLFRGRAAATITNVYAGNVYASNLYVTNIYGTVITNVYNNFTNSYITNLWVTNIVVNQTTVLSNLYSSNFYTTDIVISNTAFFNNTQFSYDPNADNIVNIKSGALVTNLIDVGTMTLGGIAYTFPGALVPGSVLVDAGGTGTLEWSDNISFGPNYWTNIAGVLQPTQGNEVIVTNLASAQVLAATGAFIIRNSLSTNLVAGENDINPNNASYILVNGFSSTPGDSSVNLSSGNGVGTFLYLVNYTALGSSFCVYDNTTMWDGGGVLSLPNGDWCPTLPGETLQLLNSGINGWQEVGRFGGGIPDLTDSLWQTNVGSANISPKLAGTLLTVNDLGSIGIGETNVFYNMDIGIFHKADTEGNRKAWINIGAASSYPFVPGTDYGSEWWANTGTNDAVMDLSWLELPSGSGTARDHVWTAGADAAFFYYETKKDGVRTFKLNGETGNIIMGDQINFGVSLTHVLYRDNDYFVFTNNSTTGGNGIQIQDGTGAYTRIGQNAASQSLFTSSDGTALSMAVNNWVPNVDAGASLGGEGVCCWWQDLGLRGTAYISGYNSGTNYSRVAISHTGATGAVVFTSQSAGTAGVPRPFSFTNAVLYANLNTPGDLGYLSQFPMVRTNFRTGVLASGDNDVYTVPTGKRLFVRSVWGGTTNQAGTSAYTQFKTNAVYYRIVTSVSMTTNAASAMVPDIVLEEGEILSVNTSTTGANFVFTCLLYDNTVPLYSPRLIAATGGLDTLYVTPAGKMAIPLGEYENLSRGSGGVMAYMNTTGGTVNVAFYQVPSGGSAGPGNILSQRDKLNNVRSIESYALGLPGDSLVFQSSSAAATQWCYVTLSEVDYR